VIHPIRTVDCFYSKWKKRFAPTLVIVMVPLLHLSPLRGSAAAVVVELAHPPPSHLTLRHLKDV